jgi:hypothetical protein
MVETTDGESTGKSGPPPMVKMEASMYEWVKTERGWRVYWGPITGEAEVLPVKVVSTTVETSTREEGSELIRIDSGTPGFVAAGPDVGSRNLPA